MTYNRFYLNILLRIVALSLTNLGFFYFLMSGERFFTTLFTGIILVIQVIWLFYYINVVNLNLSRFLLMLGEEETKIIPLKTKVEKVFGGLQHSFQRLNEEMAGARLEREYAAVLIQNIVNHSATGIIAWDQDGIVELINRSAMKMLDRQELHSLTDLNHQYPGLSDWLLTLSEDDKGTWKLERDGTKSPLAFRSVGFRLGEKNIMLVSFQNIGAELEQSEMESWEKLIRVLTHEVSNSVTPITTLGSNIRKRIDSAEKQKSGDIIISGDLSVDIQRSAELIEQRGNGLIDFIGQYKTFMRLPEPDIRSISLKELIEDACKFGENLESGFTCKISSRLDSPDIQCRADRKMIDQVLINLIRNALEAIPSDREGLIEISVHILDSRYTAISIKDNGSGIQPEIIDQVFIPFFTTKEKGSGIGLSFCRRIINMNGGNIQVATTSSSGTTMRLTLPGI